MTASPFVVRCGLGHAMDCLGPDLDASVRYHCPGCGFSVLVAATALTVEHLSEPVPCGTSITTRYLLGTYLVRQDVEIQVAEGVLAAAVGKV